MKTSEDRNARRRTAMQTSRTSERIQNDPPRTQHYESHRSVLKKGIDSIETEVVINDVPDQVHRSTSTAIQRIHDQNLTIRRRRQHEERGLARETISRSSSAPPSKALSRMERHGSEGRWLEIAPSSLADDIVRMTPSMRQAERMPIGFNRI